MQQKTEKLVRSICLAWFMASPGFAPASPQTPDQPQILGNVKDSTGQAVSNLTVQAFTTIDCASTTISASTDASGNFSLSVFDGDWQVALSQAELNARGYRAVFGQ